MPTYRGPINNDRRTCLLKYGQTLPQQDAVYTLQCSESYFNLDLSEIYINARNPADAVAIWLDYQNRNLDCRVPHDGYEMMVNIPDYDEEDSDEQLVEKFVQHMFENDYLWMKRRTICLNML